MTFARIYAIFLRQMYLIKSNPTRLFSIFLWTVIDIIQWGFIIKYLDTLGRATFGFVSVVLGAIIMWEFMSRIQTGIMTSFLEDIWSQNFINYFSSPLKINEYVAGLVLNSVVLGGIGFTLMIIIAGLGFGYNFFKIGIVILPFLFVLFLFGVAMGIFITAVIFRLGPSAEWLGWPIPLVLSIFAGVFYPVSTLPKVLASVSAVIPASYVFESLRGILSGSLDFFGLLTDLLLASGLALIYLYLTFRFLVSVYRRNLRTGNIARFNAEEF